MDTPRSRVTKPMIKSGGAGLQHFASVVSKPPSPSTNTLFLSPDWILDFFTMLVVLIGAGAGSTNAPQAFWMARGVISPCPSAVNKSSSSLKPSFSHKCCWLGLGLILLMIFSS